MKTILYLDQNFVSNMAKAPYKPSLASYQRLFETLLRLVEANVIACPMSEFHHRETLYCNDEPLKRAIQYVTSQLSKGLGFREWSDIVETQTVKAIHGYMGKESAASTDGWEEAFQRDPDIPASSAASAVNPLYVEASPFFEADLFAKHTYPERARRITSKVKARGVTFERRLKEHFAVFARISYIDPLKELWLAQAQLVAGERYDPFNLLPSFSSRVYQEFCGLLGRDDPPRFVRFLLSQQFKDIPFARIFCLLHATMETSAAKPEASEYDDTMILATVLPYSDVVATDRRMKNLLMSLGLDRQFGAQVFSATQRDLTGLFKLLEKLGGDPLLISSS